MKKSLSVVGNSLALIIDRPLCRLLGVTRHSLVRVVFDGQRLIIEPTGERVVRDASSRKTVPDEPQQQTSSRSSEVSRAVQAEADAQFFEQMFSSIGQAELDRLHQPPMRLSRFRGELLNPGSGAELRTTMRRLRECNRRRNAGETWDAAIEAALIAVPLTRGDSL